MLVSGNGEGGGGWEKAAVKQASATGGVLCPNCIAACGGTREASPEILPSPRWFWLGAGPATLHEWGLDKGLGWELLKHPSGSGKHEMMLM